MTDTDDLQAAIYEKVHQGYLRVVGQNDAGELLHQDTEAGAEVRDLAAQLATAQAERDDAIVAANELARRLEDAPCVVDEHQTLAAQLATARIVTDRLLGGWELDLELDRWDPPESLDTADGWGISQPVTDAQRVWLAGSTEQTEENHDGSDG